MNMDTPDAPDTNRWIDERLRAVVPSQLICKNSQLLERLGDVRMAFAKVLPPELESALGLLDGVLELPAIDQSFGVGVKLRRLLEYCGGLRNRCGLVGLLSGECGSERRGEGCAGTSEQESRRTHNRANPRSWRSCLNHHTSNLRHPNLEIQERDSS